MKAVLMIGGLAVLVTTLVDGRIVASSGAPGTIAPTAVKRAYGALPMAFETNQGQTDASVTFLARGQGYGVLLAPTEIRIALHGRQQIIGLQLPGANHSPSMAGLDKLPGVANYFIGSDRSKWRSGIPTYARVAYRNVYDGVDLVCYGNGRQLEYDFVVSPGADPKSIALAFSGVADLRIDAGGDLVLDASANLRMPRPAVYQDDRGRRRTIPGQYVVKGKNVIGFEVGAYDPSKPLVIDPVLAYSTYLGGSGSEVGIGLTVDSSGHAYATGQTSSVDFPVTAGAADSSGDGSSDAFVTKLAANGAALVYSTYLGGSSGSEAGTAVAVDALGNAYVAGETGSPDFPTTVGAFDTSFNGGGADAFVAKLDATGALVYATFLGGSGFDTSGGIEVDAGGAVYVDGTTLSSDFPTSIGAFQTALAGSSSAFVTKIAASGSTLIYSTYLGGSGSDLGYDIALDAAGNVFVGGWAESEDFPTTAGVVQPFKAGGVDSFVAKLNPTGSALVYSTYIGGSDTDVARGISVDASGSAYLAGTTRSTDFPTTAGAFAPTPNGGFPDSFDGFVTKLDAAGATLVYSTFLGGTGSDRINGLSLDASGRAYVTGFTTSTDFPVTAGAVQSVHGDDNGNYDVFVTALNATGSALAYSTYLGGADNDEGLALAVSAAGDILVTGDTSSGDFPTTAGAFAPSYAGNGDAFVAKIAGLPIGPPTDKDQCKDGGWRRFNNPAFRNQGQCVSFVVRR